MNIHKISATHNIDKPACGKILLKVGMKSGGIIRHMVRKNNQYKECGIYGILQQEYFEKNPLEQTPMINILD
ncbi:hypothetical protein ACSBO6_09975 [Bacillus sp. AL-1R]